MSTIRWSKYKYHQYGSLLIPIAILVSLQESSLVKCFSTTQHSVSMRTWSRPTIHTSSNVRMYQSLQSAVTNIELEPKNTTQVGEAAIPTIKGNANSQESIHVPIEQTAEAELSLSVEKDDIPSDDEYKRGMAIIACITVLFSSNSPVLHSAFVSVSQKPPVLLLNAMTSLVALAGIFLGGPILDASIPLPCTVTDEEDESCLTAPEDLSTQGGLELGTWKMLGTTANLYGLSLTSADHGAFLIQLTTLIVPAVQGIMGIPIPKRIWTSIGLALVGVFLFTQDQGGDGMAAMTSLKGDALCVVAAIFYATYDLRLFEWGKKVQPLKLIRKKIAVQASLSFALLAALGREEGMEFMASIRDNIRMGQSHDLLIIGAVVLWSGFVINAIVPFLQVGGQQAVGATRAQVVYASQPLWAALISLILLGETLGREGLYGGIFFLAAIFLAASAEIPEPDCEQDICEV